MSACEQCCPMIERTFNVVEIRHVHMPGDWEHGIDVHRVVWMCFVLTNGVILRARDGQVAYRISKAYEWV